jgi:hypothetical protein
MRARCAKPCARMSARLREQCLHCSVLPRARARTSLVVQGSASGVRRPPAGHAQTSDLPAATRVRSALQCASAASTATAGRRAALLGSATAAPLSAHPRTQTQRPTAPAQPRGAGRRVKAAVGRPPGQRSPSPAANFPTQATGAAGRSSLPDAPPAVCSSPRAGCCCPAARRAACAPRGRRAPARVARRVTTVQRPASSLPRRAQPALGAAAAANVVRTLPIRRRASTPPPRWRPRPFRSATRRGRRTWRAGRWRRHARCGTIQLQKALPPALTWRWPACSSRAPRTRTAPQRRRRRPSRRRRPRRRERSR